MIYSLLLALAFLIHNLEEYLFFDQMPRVKFVGKIYNRKSFLFSIIVLSVIVVFFAVWGCLYKSVVVWNINIIILCALTINAIQHCLLSIWYQRILPGVVSALFFIIPISVFYFIKLFKLNALSYFDIIKYFVISVPVMVFLLIITLSIGNFLQGNKYE